MSQVPTHQLTIDEVHAGRDWSALERDLIAACALGRPAVLAEDIPSFIDGSMEPPEASEDPDDPRRIRPALIRYLMLGGCDGKRGVRPHPSGIKLTGAWIAGMLDFAYCRSHLNLSLGFCHLPDGGRLTDAWIGALYLPSCRVKSELDLQRLRADGNVFLTDRFHCTGLVDLRGARIGGHLSLSGGTLAATSGRALNCDGAEIEASVFLRDGFRAEAEVNFVCARIGGQLSCSGGTFAATEGWALDCNAAEIGADVFLRDGFEATAEVSFRGARIGGQVDCTSGTFAATEGRALDCNAAEIGADVFLRGGFAAVGGVDFTHA